MSKLIRQIVTTAKLGKPLGPYSTAVIADRTVYISGCLGIDAETGKMVPGGVAAEAKKALENMGIVLESADSSYDKVVKVTVFLNDIADFGAVNEEYKKGKREDHRRRCRLCGRPVYGHKRLIFSVSVFAVNPPARSCFQVGKLPANGLVEIEAIAMTGDVETIVLNKL